MKKKLLDRALADNLWGEELLDRSSLLLDTQKEVLRLLIPEGDLSLIKLYWTRLKEPASGLKEDWSITNSIRFFIREGFIGLQRDEAKLILKHPAFIRRRPLFHLELADFLWRALGVTSDGFDYYTRRLSLAWLHSRALEDYIKDRYFRLEKDLIRLKRFGSSLKSFLNIAKKPFHQE